MKYRNAILVIIIYFVMGLVPLLIIPADSYPFTRLLPGANSSIQVTELFFLYPVVILIFGIVSGYLMTPIYLFPHKNIFGRKMTYGLFQRPKQAKEKFTTLSKGFFAGLVAINFATMLIPYFSNQILHDYVFTWGRGQSTFFSFIVLLLFTAVVASILYSGVWYLEDAGIVYTNKEQAATTHEIVEIKSVSGWYNQLLKGYAGIGVLFTYTHIITEFWASMQVTMDPLTTLLLLSINAPIPIYATMATLPTIITLDITKTYRVNFTLKIAQKMGVAQMLDYSA